MRLNEIDNDMRIVFKKGIQKKLLEDAKSEIKSSWRGLARKLNINVSSGIICDYKDEKFPISAGILKSLLKITQKDFTTIEGYIIETRKRGFGCIKDPQMVDKYEHKFKEWNKKAGQTVKQRYGSTFYSKIGKLGRKAVDERYSYEQRLEWWRSSGLQRLNKYGLQYFSKLGKIGGPKGGKARAEKYSKEILSKWGKKGGSIGGKHTVERYGSSFFQKIGKTGGVHSVLSRGMKNLHSLIDHLTPRRGDLEIELEERIKMMELNYKIFYQRKINGFFHTFDFAYYHNNRLRLLEEVIGSNNRNYLFYKTYDLVEKRKLFNLPIVATMKLRLGKYELHPLVPLILLENNIMPIILPLVNRENLILDIIHKKTVDNEIKKIKNFVTKYLKKKKDKLYIAALNESKRESKDEKKLSSIFRSLKLNPHGKQILMSNYGTYIVPDDYFYYNDFHWYVFLSCINAQSSFLNKIKEHAAYTFLVKNYYKTSARCLSIIVYPRLLAEKYFKERILFPNYSISLLQSVCDKIVWAKNFSDTKKKISILFSRQ